jgi:hypothetical protein
MDGLMDLRDQFKADVMAATEHCYAIGYTPNKFKRMINEQHPVEVGKRLVLSGDLQYGIRELAKLSHLELTIESIMLKPEFLDLFTEDERAAAQWRLKEVQRT